jgi:hypothetical protein
MHLGPVDYAIHKIGGVRALARAIGRYPSSISKWKRKGVIPSSARIPLISYAEKNGIDLTSRDLDFGRDVAKRKRA